MSRIRTLSLAISLALEILQLWGPAFVANLALLIKSPSGISTSLSILSIQLRDFIIKLSSIFIQSSFEWYSNWSDYILPICATSIQSLLIIYDPNTIFFYPTSLLVFHILFIHCSHHGHDTNFFSSCFGVS